MNKLTKKIKENYLYLLYIFFLIIINAVMLYFLSGKRIFTGILIVIASILILGYSFIFSKKIKIEKLYLLIMIPIGLLYLVFFPINNLPDEWSHILRAYEISEGHLVSNSHKNKKNKIVIGEKMNKDLRPILKVKKLQDEQKYLLKEQASKNVFYTTGAASLYSFLCYIPQTTGILIGKLLHLPVIIQIYLARLFNFLVFTFLTYIAIKIIPFKKNIMFIILLFPMILQEAVSSSPDALTISLSLFLLAFTLKLRKEKETEITKKEITILTISSVILSACKIVYLPICFIIFLIPKTKFKSTKQKYLILIAISLLAIITNLVWLKLSAGFLPKTEDVDSAKQLKYIFTHPLSYVIIMIRTIVSYYHTYFICSIGNSLGNFKVAIPDIYISVLGIIFIFTLIFDNYDINKNNILKVGEKLFIGILIIMVCGLISTSLYLQWNKVANMEVDGIQGRYFIPLFFLLACLFSKYKISPKINITNKYVLLFLITVNSYAIAAILFNFV